MSNELWFWLLLLAFILAGGLMSAIISASTPTKIYGPEALFP